MTVSRSFDGIIRFWRLYVLGAFGGLDGVGASIMSTSSVSLSGESPAGTISFSSVLTRLLASEPRPVVCLTTLMPDPRFRPDPVDAGAASRRAETLAGTAAGGGGDTEGDGTDTDGAGVLSRLSTGLFLLLSAHVVFSLVRSGLTFCAQGAEAGRIASTPPSPPARALPSTTLDQH